MNGAAAGMTDRFKTSRQPHADPETLALTLLTWLAAEPELFSRFLALSGMQPGQIAAIAGDPAFLGGLVDFIMGNEPDLLRFCEATGTPPEAVSAAWHRLGGAGLDSGVC